MAFLSPAQGLSQALNEDNALVTQACIRVSTIAGLSVPLPPEVTPGHRELIEAEIDSLLASTLDIRVLRERVWKDSLWIAHRGAFELILAERVADAYKYGLGTAHSSAKIYQNTSARAGPMLLALLNGNNETRRPIGLRAINGPLSDVEADVVLRFACDAEWALEAVRGNEDYARSALRVLDLQWPVEAKRTLIEARRLLSGARRRVVEAALSAPWMTALEGAE